MGNDTADEQRTGASDIEAAWRRFTARLATEAAELSPFDVLRFGGSGNRYAQFSITGPVVGYEIVANRFLEEGFEMSAAAEALMLERGWQPGGPNWVRELDWSARFGDRHEYTELAERTVTALREILGFAHPNELERVQEELFHRRYSDEAPMVCVYVEPGEGYLRECYSCGASGTAAWSALARCYETGDEYPRGYCAECPPRVGVL